MDRTAQLQVIIGPMFSVKYKKDTRYSDECMSTHDKQLWQAVPAMKLEDVEAYTRTAEVIGIDEGQFFPDLVDFCERMANSGKTVIVACLDGTFQRKAFGDVLNLIPLAESVTKLNAVCMLCYKDAAFTKRLGSETQVEVIGGADKYISVCRQCFHEPVAHHSQLNIVPAQSTAKKQKTPLNMSVEIEESVVY